jgi:hypothetical protein
MKGGGGALTRSGLDDNWDDERDQFTVEPLLPLAPKQSLQRDVMAVRQPREAGPKQP